MVLEKEPQNSPQHKPDEDRVGQAGDTHPESPIVFDFDNRPRFRVTTDD